MGCASRTCPTEASPIVYDTYSCPLCCPLTLCCPTPPYPSLSLHRCTCPTSLRPWTRRTTTASVATSSYWGSSASSPIRDRRKHSSLSLSHEQRLTRRDHACTHSHTSPACTCSYIDTLTCTHACYFIASLPPCLPCLPASHASLLTYS